MLLTMLLAAAQPAADAVPAANPVMVDLIAHEGGGHCLPDGQICFALPGEADSGALPANLVVSFPGSGDTENTALPLPAFAGEPQALHLWPHAVWVRRGDEADGKSGLEMLVGVIGEQRAMYSGGGGSGSRLHLLRFGMAPHAIALGSEVLDVEWDSSLMIRACFSEQDMKDRLDACHDEYKYKAVLQPAPADGGELPALTYRSFATAYPQTSRRSEDNSGQKLKSGDLADWKDPDCSYQRLLRYNPATARYEMDRPAPDCSSYTTP
ncbi:MULTISPECIES: hypothetical protein [unclassified Sphingopyxis]|jgi:hypothetical protein|uniref:hypothetical protein n=1 Tax=unclassified Sphingopyxis TaxID=2614943 RepID=UPI00285BDE86|nr:MULTISPECIES: hypothetical protein [unclassified Sphingopyxis]MDR6834511.1 hypothetical protein [Sphingopyxis sp. BE122]MDR7226781.1 hypothetical protein [Sphingopyxis sp. BE259]